MSVPRSPLEIFGLLFYFLSTTYRPFINDVPIFRFELTLDYQEIIILFVTAVFVENSPSSSWQFRR